MNKEQKKLLDEIKQYFDPHGNICDLVIMYEMTGYKVYTETSKEFWEQHIGDVKSEAMHNIMADGDDPVEEPTERMSINE